MRLKQLAEGLASVSGPVESIDHGPESIVHVVGAASVYEIVDGIEVA